MARSALAWVDELMGYAKGKHAWGICDKTGFRYPISDLVYEYNNGVKTGRRVGRDVVDPDHPQNFIGEVDTSDNQSLYDPRPDPRDDIGLFGWNPVGNPAQYIRVKAGKVRVIIG